MESSVKITLVIHPIFYVFVVKYCYRLESFLLNYIEERYRLLKLFVGLALEEFPFQQRCDKILGR